MNQDDVQTFLQAHRQAVLATIRADCRSQLSNVLAAWHEGRLLVSTRETTAKYRNVSRDPRVTVLVLGDSFWQFMVVDGEADIIRLPEALPLLRTYYRIAAGKDHPDWEEYDRAMRDERRVLLSIAINNAHGYNVS